MDGVTWLSQYGLYHNLDMVTVAPKDLFKKNQILEQADHNVKVIVVSIAFLNNVKMMGKAYWPGAYLNLQ